jgi:integrase
MIAAGLDAKQLSVYMGHASISTTYDVYGWLMAGSADSAVSRIDAYLARADTARRISALDEA